MAAGAVMQGTQVRRKGSKVQERIFFGGMSLLLLATVLLGFARSYFLAGMVRAALPSVLVHVHGAVFTAWMLLYVVQTTLVAARRVKWHMTLGLMAYGVAAAMVPLGVLAGFGEVKREAGAALLYTTEARGFAISGILAMLLFGGLALGSYVMRRRPDAHKRLVLLATISLMDAGIFRWPGMTAQVEPWVFAGYVLLLVGYDLVSVRRVHAVTAWGAPLVLVVKDFLQPIAAFLAVHVVPGFLVRVR